MNSRNTIPNANDIIVTKWKKAKFEFERSYFQELLHLADGNISKASRISGMYRTELYSKIKSLQLNVKKFKENRVNRTEFVANKSSAFAIPISFSERAIYAKFAKYSEFAGYAEYAEFANFADQERYTSKFMQLAKEEIKNP